MSLNMNLDEKDINQLNDIIKKIKTVKVSDTEQKINDMVCFITSERKNKNISQSELSVLSGVPQTTISRIENFASKPSLPILIKIISALDLELKITQSH